MREGTHTAPRCRRVCSGRGWAGRCAHDENRSHHQRRDRTKGRDHHIAPSGGRRLRRLPTYRSPSARRNLCTVTMACRCRVYRVTACARREVAVLVEATGRMSRERRRDARNGPYGEEAGRTKPGRCEQAGAKRAFGKPPADGPRESRSSEVVQEGRLDSYGFSATGSQGCSRYARIIVLRVVLCHLVSFRARGHRLS